MSTYDFKFTDQQVQILRAGLLELPGKIGLNVLNELAQQLQPQLKPVVEAPQAAAE